MNDDLSALCLWGDGPVIRFHDVDVFRLAAEQLADEGLQVARFDARSWLHVDDFLLAAWDQLALPRATPPALVNLNSFLIDERPTKGLVFAFENFDAFWNEDQETASVVLDMIVHHSRRAAFSRSLWIALVHIENRKLALPRVGALNVSLNRRETWHR